jgi:DNA-binding NtrC family response regulator
MPETPQRVLIVEDEAIVALDIRRQLESLGYEVVGTAATSQKAREMARQSLPDIVLMDIHLADGGDGIETARQIRCDRPVPVVFLTAYADPETLTRAKETQPYGYIVKPFHEDDLRTTVEIALHKGRIDDALRKSHENLLAILDVQRQGTILIETHGRVTFCSRAARRMLGSDAGDPTGLAWQDVLPLSADAIGELATAIDSPGDQRGKIPATFRPGSEDPTQVEIEIRDDPRDVARKIVFLYDVSDVQQLRRQLDQSARFEGIVGKSAGIRGVVRLIEDLAQIDSIVLIDGESGTGKELVARAIHRRSHRRDEPFLPLNCAGLSEELAASQLFGHRKGAFTGAVEDRPGMFEAAAGGVLFLDEIGELPLRVQTTLLRVLEENAVMRLGETQLRDVSPRILVASNRDLAGEAAQGRFRSDLLYRIRVARVSLPPLRDRREDIPLLVRVFLAQLRVVIGKPVDAVDDEALAALMDYDWPGNVRELKNALEFAVIRTRGSSLKPEDLPPELFQLGRAAGRAVEGDSEEDEKSRILTAIQQCDGNRTAAAQTLGIGRATLYRRIAQLGIDEAE